MSTDEGAASTDPSAAAGEDDAEGAAVATEAATPPNWWHRDHPTFTALTGFFTGLATVIVVPGIFAAILSALFDYERAQELFGFVVIVFVVPFALLLARRTRRFGLYMLIGMLSTAVVVAGVGALVLFVLIRLDA